MVRRFVLVIIAIALSAGSAAGAPAAVPRTEYDPAHGVRATVTGNTVEVRFTGASAAFGTAHAGQRVTFSCGSHPPPGLAFAGTGVADAFGFALGALAPGRVTADGASVSATLPGAPGDACDIEGDDPALPSSDQARAALTPAGTTWIDEQTLGTRMVDLAYAADPSGTYRSAPDVVALGGGSVVALDSPDATPPAGKLGYWSDGRAVSFVATSAAGRRLVLQDPGDGMLRTDVLDAVLSWRPPQGEKVSDETDDGATDDDDGDDDPDAYGGPGDGVTAHLAGRTLVVRFSGPKAAKAYRAIAGRRAAVECLAAPPPLLLLGGRMTFGRVSRTTVRVPRRGGIVRAALAPGPADICALRRGNRQVATVTPTAAGSAYVGGLTAFAAFLSNAPRHLVALGATAYPDAAAIAAAHRGLVAMTTPGQRLVPGRIGVWTDAHQRALLAMGTPTGQRFVVADEGGGRIRTNILTALLAVNASLT